MKILISVWNKIPPRLQEWLKGLEVFVVTGVITALVTSPSADFTTRAGIVKFLGSIAAVAGGCVRLYLAQSPIQKVLIASQTEREVTDGSLTVKTKQTDLITGPNPPKE